MYHMLYLTWTDRFNVIAKIFLYKYECEHKKTATRFGDFLRCVSIRNIEDVIYNLNFVNPYFLYIIYRVFQRNEHFP